MSSLDEAYSAMRGHASMPNACPFQTQADDLANRIITEENQYEFTFWALSLKPPSIDDESFNMLLSLSIPQWIASKSQTWIVAYTPVIDSAREQAAAVEQFSAHKSDHQQENIKISSCPNPIEAKPKSIRPTDPAERRALFASVYEKRLNKNYKKKKSKPHL